MGRFFGRKRRKDQAERFAHEAAEIVKLLDSLGKCIAAVPGTTGVPAQPKPDGVGDGGKTSWVDETLTRVKERDKNIVPKEEMLETLRKMAHEWIEKGYDWDDAMHFVVNAFSPSFMTPLIVKWLFEIRREETVN